ncbi:MAG: hypothetical protein ACTTIM_03175 [Campylobacter sp.]
MQKLIKFGFCGIKQRDQAKFLAKFILIFGSLVHEICKFIFC